jgi:acyl carrier protein
MSTGTHESTGTAEDRAALTCAVWEVLSTQLPLTNLEPDPALVLRNLPGADSIRVMRSVAGLERRFGVEFDDSRIFALTTLGDLIDLVAATIAQPSAKTGTGR